MKYGLALPNAGVAGDARTLAEFASVAEQAGWDGVFLEDYITHHSASDAPTYDPWVALAVMALRTERILLGTSVTPLTRRRPWKVAREAVTLDHLSNGRLILGVGLGDLGDPGFAKVGEEIDNWRRAKMLDEALDIVMGLWSGEPFSYHGTYYSLDEVTFLPTPVQKPRIPIWVGGNSPHRGPLLRAARWDGFCGGKENDGTNWLFTPDELRELKAFFESHRTTSAPFDIVIGGNERGDDPERERASIKALAEAGATWWVEYVTPSIGGVDAMRERIKGGPLRID